MKYLIRRIKYTLAGRVMRLIAAVCSFIVLCVLAILLLSGKVNQKDLVTKFFNFIWRSSSELSEKVENPGDLPVELTEDGVYFKGKAPGKGKDSSKKDTNENSKDKKNKEDKKDSDKKDNGKDKELKDSGKKNIKNDIGEEVNSSDGNFEPSK